MMSLSEKLKQLREIMSACAQVRSEDLTKIQHSVIFIHFLNLQNNLECIDRNGEKIEFPQNWNQDFEGVYKFIYRQKKEKGKTYQFRYIDAGEGNGRIKVNFVQQDGDDLHQAEVQYIQSEIEERSKNYQKWLSEILNPQKEQKNREKNNPLEVRRLQPVWRQPQPNQRPFPVQPMNGPSSQPFGIPFSGQEYVGPNSGLFVGRGPNQPNFNGRRPPGSRFDPIDPFGNEQFDDPGNNDFSGFNSFGQPFGGNRGFGPFGGNGNGNNNFYQ